MYRKRLTTALLFTTTLAVAFAPAASAHRPDPVQRQLDLLVEGDGVPGALAFDGRTTRTAGVADLGTGRAMVGSEGSFRLAGNTKTFTATAVMRLVVDGRIQLDHRAFEPGGDCGYSNTNYLVLGMVIDQVTGVGFRTYIEREILRPLRLADTYWPAPGELALRGPHARNYGVDPADPAAGRVDVTELPGYEFGASGGLVSTPGDLNAFWDGLFGGRLLPGWAARLMTRDTSDIGGRDVCPAGSRYGYGVASVPLSCGGVYWGHGDDLPGGSVGGGRASGGRPTVTVYTTTWTAEGEGLRHLQGAVDAALCTGGH